MRRRFRWDKKYLYWGITAFLVIAGGLLFYTLLRYFPDVSSGWNRFMLILSPFVLGAVLTYLLTPMTKLFERILSSKRMKNALIKGKFARIIRKLPVEDLQTMVDEDGGCEVVCKMCGNKYQFSKETLEGYITAQRVKKMS